MSFVLTISNVTAPAAPFTAILSVHVNTNAPAAIAPLAVKRSTVVLVAAVANAVVAVPPIVAVHVVAVTALQIATGWKDNKILKQATGYLVHLFKRRSNPGVVAQVPKTEKRDKVDEFCSEFIDALKAAADTTNDEYLESIKGVFELKSDT